MKKEKLLVNELELSNRTNLYQISWKVVSFVERTEKCVKLTFLKGQANISDNVTHMIGLIHFELSYSRRWGDLMCVCFCIHTHEHRHSQIRILGEKEHGLLKVTCINLQN